MLMRTGKRLFLCGILLLAGFLIWSALQFSDHNGADTSGTSKRYLAIVPDDAVGQNTPLEEGMKAAASECDAYLQFLSVSSFAEQQTAVDKALYSGYDGLLLCPMDNGTEALAMLESVTKQGLGLVTLFNSIYNQAPCYASAQEIGESAAQEFLNRASLQDNIYILIGDQQNISYQNRASSFTESLEASGIQISGTLALDIDMVSSYKQVKEFIKENQAHYIFCTDAASTALAARCLDSYLPTSPTIIGCDYLESNISYYDPELLSAFICTDYYQTGYDAAAQLNSICGGTQKDTIL